MSDRYEGKPFLRLLDSYVMDAIGHLDEANARWLTAAEPNFRHDFGEQGTWKQIVEARMQFPAGMADAIREVWEKGRAQAHAAGQDVQPGAFAIQFVDSNFPH